MDKQELYSQELYSIEQSRALDRYWIEQQGILGSALMERAAQASLGVLRQHWPRVRTILVLCGAGNNAGDGWALARLANQAGLQAQVLCVRDPQQLRGDAASAAQHYLTAGGRWQAWSEAAAAALHPAAELVVDALLGSGLIGPPRSDYAAVIHWANACGRPILALDLPTGLNGDTGVAGPPCIQAQATVTFIARKPGLYTGFAPDYVGKVYFAALIHAEERARGQSAALPLAYGALLNPTEVLATLPRRRPTTHKGEAGHVLVFGGGRGMPGAALLAGSAALRSGAGMVSLLTHIQHATQLVVYQPELMIHPWGEDAAAAASFVLSALLRRCKALVFGPGLGQDAWAESALSQLFIKCLPQLDGPMPKIVVDADGLNLLAQHQEVVQQLSAACSVGLCPWVLTPHPGEAARLLNTSTAAVQQDRVAAAQALAQHYHAVVILKGAGTVIAHPDGRYTICELALAAMASAGMGDVLSGLLGALLGQGMNAWDAAQAAVYLHLQAGVEAAGGRSRGVLASDLIQQLPSLFP